VGASCDDDDADLVSNAVDVCPLVQNREQADEDGDRVGDPCDPDDDGDGVCDFGAVDLACVSSDLCPNSEPESVDLNGCSQAQVDEDLDGACDPGVVSTLCGGSDACPHTAASMIVDTDGCSQAQVDEDLDGVCDVGRISTLCEGWDSCPGTTSEHWLYTSEVDPYGCAILQVDGDLDLVCTSGIQSSWCTGSDNCPNVANPAQTDTDADGFGDECDPDDDGDGYADGSEAHVGTAELVACGASAWPADLTAGGVPNSTNRVTILDLSSFLAPVRYFGTDTDTHPGDERWDIVPGAGAFSADINIADLSSVVTVAPPMLGGVRAFNGPACSAP
jgi:hypothetical protein